MLLYTWHIICFLIYRGGKYETIVAFYIVVSVLNSTSLAHSKNEQNAKEGSTSSIIGIRTIKQLFGL
jgi:hypothetical protein